MKFIPVFAHRGASGYRLENTIQAFNEAIKKGADGVELDVQCTKDGVLVVYHDLNLYRLTGEKKFINKTDSHHIFQYRLGKHFFQRKFCHYHIPSLQHILQWANKNEIPLNIELKESLLTNIKPLLHLLKNSQLPKGSHFSSFHQKLLKIVKLQNREAETALIVTKNFNWENVGENRFFDVIHANKKYYKDKYLTYLEKAKLDIRFYNINGSEPFLQNPHPNVIGWITDYPDRIKNIQKKTFKQKE